MTLAQVNGPTLDITSILQFGLLGMIFLCLVFRKFLVPEWTLNTAEEKAVEEKAALNARIAELQAQLTRLQDTYQDQLIPALTRGTEINARYLEELQDARIARGGRP